MSSSTILLDNSSQSHYSKLDNLTTGANADLTATTSEDEPSPSSPEDVSSNPSTSPSSHSEEEKKPVALARTRRASLNKPQGNAAAAPAAQTSAPVLVSTQASLPDALSRESRPSVSSASDEKSNRVTIKNPKRRPSVTSQSSIQEQPLSSLPAKKPKSSNSSKPMSGSKIDFGSLDFNTLKKYKRVYKLRTKSNVTKSELVMAVQEHHSQQNVNESDVISSFMNTVKRQTKLNAPSGSLPSSLTNSSVSPAAPYLVASFQTTNRGGSGSSGGASGDHHAKQTGKLTAKLTP